jgi:carboxyl-terminal processing protease
MNNKKLQVWFPLFFSVSMVMGMFLGYQLRDKMPFGGTIIRASSGTQMQEVISLIRNRYVDQVNTDSLSELAIEEVLTHLDPHSIYIPASKLTEVNEDLAGKFEGIGVEFNIFEDTVHILNVLEGGPSDKAGLHVGDRIIRVEQQTVAGNGITSDKIRGLLRGQGGSKVNITVKRDTSSLPFTITRGFIPLFSLDAAYMMDTTTGYIRLNKFSESTYEEFMAALEGLNKEGMKKLVLDLRDNGGGILDEAVEIADEFLDGDKLIVYTQGKNSPRREYKCRRRGLFEQGELVLLMNEGSASASEVLAGALQDWDRATIIGRRSFGKGLVQEQYTLRDGAALRLTVARYYTPLGRSIQKPYDKGLFDYNGEILNRYQHGEMFSADSNKVNNGTAYKTTNGKKVYGGGGITPDIFVAFDSTTIDTVITALYRKNTIGNFVYRYYIKNIPTFSAYKNPETFVKSYTVSNAIYKELEDFAAKDSINISHLSARDRQFLETRVKSLFARQIWRTDGFYEVINASDPVILKAKETIH